jgi:hypothetical protein
MSKVSIQVMRAAQEAMIAEFGQTPAQLLKENEAHPPRQVITPNLDATQPLPGYCSNPGTGEEVAQSLVHILLEVSALERMQTVLSAHGSGPQTPTCRSPAALSTESSPAVDAVAHVQARSHPGNIASTPSPAGALPRRSASAHGQVAPSMMTHMQRVGHSAHNGILRVGSMLSALAPGGGAARGVRRGNIDAWGEATCGQMQWPSAGKAEPCTCAAEASQPSPKQAMERAASEVLEMRRQSLAGASSIASSAPSRDTLPIATEGDGTKRVVDGLFGGIKSAGRGASAGEDSTLDADSSDAPRMWPQRLQDSLRVRCPVLSLSHSAAIFICSAAV